VNGLAQTALAIGGAWLAGGALAAWAITRAIRNAPAQPKTPTVVPKGYAEGRADLQMNHKPKDEQP
jgi:hypothetical protein